MFSILSVTYRLIIYLNFQCLFVSFKWRDPIRSSNIANVVTISGLLAFVFNNLDTVYTQFYKFWQSPLWFVFRDGVYNMLISPLFRLRLFVTRFSYARHQLWCKVSLVSFPLFSRQEVIRDPDFGPFYLYLDPFTTVPVWVILKTR